jgi:hypothetical protein
MPWTAFAPAGNFVTAATLDFVDPCLAWAEAQGFVDQCLPGARTPTQVPVVVELRPGQSPADLQALLSALPGGSAVRPHYLLRNTRYCSALFSPEACVALAVPAHQVVRRFEFAMPMLPRRAPVPTRPPASGTPAPRTRQAAGGSHLLAVIDTGCPIAHGHFRNGAHTRLLGLWDQDANPAFHGVAGAGVPADFGYGAEIGGPAIDALLAACMLPGGTLDEDSCYERAGYHELRPRATHGAFVMDQFVGPLRLGERMSLHPDNPPQWRRDPTLTPESSSADVVFVQLSRGAWADPSGNALAASVLDGVRYVLDHAGPDTREIIVNISCAIYTGPRNGTTVLEQALAGLVSEVASTERSLRVCMPAGNSYVSRWHAGGVCAAGTSQKLRLRVPVCSEAPTFVQVWARAERPFAATVTAPGSAGGPSSLLVAGAAASLSTPGSAVPVATALHTTNHVRGAADRVGAGTMLWLAIRPTEVHDASDAPAPSGEWTIELQSAGDTEYEVNVARSETELGAPLRARPARLFDERDDVDRYLRPQLADQVPPLPGISIRRMGTLSGAACGSGTPSSSALTLRIPPAELPGRVAWPLPGPVGLGPSDYASAGPPPPNASAICDESWALQGVRGAGSRSASVVRLTGSSFASPQLARALADGVPLAPPGGSTDRWGTYGSVVP